MGQTNFKRTKAAAATPSEWLGVSAAVGRMVNSWTSRFDIVAVVNPTAGDGAPACYIPSSAEVEVNAVTCFYDGVDPEDLADLDVRATQYEWPRATGVIFHEACHAMFSQWSLKDASETLTKAEFNALLQLEEGRIERHGIQKLPSNAGFLRAASMDIMLNDSVSALTDSDTVTAANIAALVLARVDAGSLEHEDVVEIEELIAEKLGVERLEKLRGLWRRMQAHSTHFDISEMHEVAREWVSTVDEAAEENGEPGMSEADTPGEGELSEFAATMAEALSDAADMSAIGAYGVLDDVRTQEEWEASRAARAQDQRVDAEAVKTSSEVFGKGTGILDDNPTRSRLVEARAPQGAERSAAVKIAQLLEKAKYRERSETEIHSILPPGRLRTRAMMQGAALKSKGVMTATEPWRRTVRKHTDDPELRIGVMVDISGSMGAAMQPMASTAWVLSEAIRRVQGKAAMVYYGNDVFATLKPGQHLSAVNVYTAPDMTEKFDKAFKALNGGLNLLHGSGVRLLVVFSDGEYTSTETVAAKRWLTECQRSGVGVLWLSSPTSANFGAQRIVAGTSAVHTVVPSDMTSAAMTIGQSAARALAAMS